MLQGNPFETRLVMDEHVTSVRRDLQGQNIRFTAERVRRVQRWWQAFRSTLGFPKSSLPSLAPIEDRR